MSLARAFTTRKAKPPQISAPYPQRSLTTKQSFPSGTIRHKISAPVELISTTNMLSYNAPDLYPSSVSSHSGDDSDSVPSLTHSPSASPDSSSRGSMPGSPEPNHLSCYFGSPARGSTSSNEDAPVIPKRALTHTKKSHETFARNRSISRASSQRKASITSFARDSINMFSANPDTSEPHPFGNELAQVSELAEEYGVQGEMQVIAEEEQELISRGLFKFCADDYMNEIHGLFEEAFMSNRPTAMWI